MYRFTFFLTVMFVPIVLGWWLFLPLTLVFVYLSKLPYEVLIAGFILDSTYYFGEGVIARHRLVLFSLLVIIVALFLDKRIHWRKII